MRRLCILLAVVATAVATAVAPAAAGNLFAWRIAGKAGTVFLLGSIHVGKPDLYPLPPPIEHAFAEAGELVEEIDMSGPNLGLLQHLIVERGLYGDGDTLETHLSVRTRVALAQYLKSTGQPPTALSRLRPWLAVVQILNAQLKALGYEPQYAIDQHFLEEAMTANKPVSGLETVQFQVDLLSGLPSDLQDKLVLSELLDAANLGQDAAAIVEAWQKGDAAAMQQLVTRADREHPELQPVTEAVVYKRNGAMTAKIEDFLNDKKTRFVVVGSLHLVGDRGILHRLADKGYKIEQLHTP